ncbi:hypothetical protein E4T51_16593 [Aureobasidium sp. EXF-12344]|nr:hypothetical protein E4T51_16593 [Aureobasidium sp. EXF-12344]
MTTLKALLERLELSRYYDVFVDEGFDTWETLMDITEADLETLGVRLGHRRKLQRAILNASKDRRPLPSPFQAIAQDDLTTQDESKKNRDYPGQQQAPQAVQETQSQEATSQKHSQSPRSRRKYRRHPKHDEHAPERPPSAYVIFSKQVRDQLKGRELSFTEIAKLVGERWQELQAHEKEPCEREAQALKNTYYAELRKYQKTPQYKQYQDYLVEFKAKHSERGGSQADNNKKPKLGHSQSLGYDESNIDVDETVDSVSATDGFDAADGDAPGQGDEGMDGVETTHGRDQAGSPSDITQPSPTYSSLNPVLASDDGTVSSYSTWRSTQHTPSNPPSHRRSHNPSLATHPTTVRSEEGSYSPASIRPSLPVTRNTEPAKPTSTSSTKLPSLTQLDSMVFRNPPHAALLNWFLHTTLPPIEPKPITQRATSNFLYSSPTTSYNAPPPRPLHPPPSLAMNDSLDVDLQSKASLSTLLRASEHVERDDTLSVHSSNHGSSSRKSQKGYETNHISDGKNKRS